MPTIAAENTTTIENLLAAFEGESNASARYTAFAVKADADSWLGAASLFRAAARAEQIHAENHAHAIRQLGGNAHCNIGHTDALSTLENLKTALAGEQYEIDTMYPAFLEEAKAHANVPAARTFTWAMEAEKTHARLYAEAIALVKADKKDSWCASRRTFYVCAACGYTTETQEEHGRCPVCNLSREKFEEIR
ncbi:MAG: ferritin family protein [Terracidiphilus sp.]